MKILHVVNSFYPNVGGIENAVKQHCEELIKKGHSCEVVCFNKVPNKDAKLPKEGEIDGIKIHRIPFFSMKYYHFAPAVFGIVKNYDIVHVHGIGFFSDFLIVTKLLHKKPVVVSTYGAVFHTKNIFLLKLIYFHIIQRVVLRFADKVIAISKNDFSLFSRIISKNLILVELGVRLDKFFAINSVKKDENKIISVGRISKNKMTNQLLDIFSIISKKNNNIKFSIIGDDWEGLVQELERQKEKLGLKNKVVFSGKVSEKELMRHYANAGFFVSASRFESFGITTIEAMAAGCIPIVNDIESFRNFIEIGKDGYITDFSDTEKTAELILMALENNPKEIRKSAVAKAHEFEWKNKINKIIKIYENIAK